MTELLPCPFCGGEAEIRGDSVSFVQCAKCGTRYGDRYHATKAEAIAAWNTRAETSYKDALILLDELGLSERTCRWEYPQNVNGWVGYEVCSSCGEKYDENVIDSAHYCPNCGAKVVEP